MAGERLKHTFHDVIDVLATNATKQGWMGGQDWENVVRRAFDQYGFGRAQEHAQRRAPPAVHRQRNAKYTPGAQITRALGNEIY